MIVCAGVLSDLATLAGRDEPCPYKYCGGSAEQHTKFDAFDSIETSHRKLFMR
jgi:hypothetical protein